MVRDYRAWLQSELQLLGDAEGHTYSLGQANMARRAMERLDAEIGDCVVLEIAPEQAAEIASELRALAQAESLPESLVMLLQLLEQDA